MLGEEEILRQEEENIQRFRACGTREYWLNFGT